MTTRIGSLCTGYSGLDMAVQAVFGGELAWWSDIEPGPIAVMERHHPGVPNIHDIKTAAPLFELLPPVDVITAGYPCQPFSSAGLRLGEKDERHLWPWIAEAVGALRPGVVVLENVARHARVGLARVVGDLAALGYDAVWTVVRASAVGAPHKRARVFVLATDAARECGSGSWDVRADRGSEHPDSGLTVTADTDDQQRQRESDEWARRTVAAGSGFTAADPGSTGLEIGSVEQAGGQRPAAQRGGGEPVADALGESLRIEPGRGSWSDGSGAAESGHPGHVVADAVRERFEGHSERDGQPLTGQDGEPARLIRGSDAAIGAHQEGCQRDRDWTTLRNGELIDYGPAIRRWHDLTRCVPAPITTGQRGARVLNPVFVEWMQGLPFGHVTDTEGLSRNAMLTLLGNGVVPQQAEYAIRQMLATRAAIDALVAA